MSTHKHFQDRVRINDPDVIKPMEINGRLTFREAVAPGRFYRVKPTTAYEVIFLSMLEHQKDKFAPRISVENDRGEGILISESAMAKIDA